MIRETKTVVIGDRRVTVRELTVGEVRVWLNQLGSEPSELIGDALFEDISLGELYQMTDVSLSDLDNFTPSELREVVTIAKELNPDFFGMRARLTAAVLRTPAPSNEQSAP